MRRIQLPIYLLCLVAAAANVQAEETQSEPNEKVSIYAFPLFHYHSESKKEKSSLGVLDLGLAKVYSQEAENENLGFEVLSVPLVDVFAYQSGKSGKNVRVLDIPFAEGFTYEGKEKGSNTDFLRVGPVEVFASETGKNNSHKTKVLDAMVTSLYESKSDEKCSETKVLPLPLLGSLFGHRNDGEKWKVTVLYLFRFSGKSAAHEPIVREEAKAGGLTNDDAM